MNHWMVRGLEAAIVASPWVLGLWYRKQLKEMEDQILIVEAMLKLTDEELEERFSDED